MCVYTLLHAYIHPRNMYMHTLLNECMYTDIYIYIYIYNMGRPAASRRPQGSKIPPKKNTPKKKEAGNGVMSGKVLTILRNRSKIGQPWNKKRPAKAKKKLKRKCFKILLFSAS